MDFDLVRTAAIFAVLIVVGVGGLMSADVMAQDTVLTMVAPSMAAFGLICVAIGVKHGEFRAQSA
jgi:ABC-type Mn2+/Zn2+ transport system permease subunit